MLSSRVSVRQFSEQDLDLLVSLASAAALRVRNVALAEQAAERKVYEKELSIAHDMQMAMLPRQMPDHPAIAVAASLEPARSVGGDLYDFVLEDDRLWFIIADVAGKSVAAALYMAVAKTLFRATIGPAADVAGVAGRMNRELSRDNERMLFVTAIVGSLDIATGVVTLIDAGHNPAVLIDAAGTMTAPAPPKGIAFGVVEDFVYTPAHVALEPGATLLLYTDGATDARSMGGEMFGEARLTHAIAAGAGLAPDALIKTITGAVDQFVAGAPPEDDLTLLAIKRRKLTD
jgi:phosphoserine phosphatase RsbU/P